MSGYNCFLSYPCLFILSDQYHLRLHNLGLDKVKSNGTHHYIILAVGFLLDIVSLNFWMILHLTSCNIQNHAYTSEYTCCCLKCVVLINILVGYSDDFTWWMTHAHTKNHADTSDYTTSCLTCLVLTNIFAGYLDDFTWWMTHKKTMQAYLII
jgi:hypothetical protein